MNSKKANSQKVYIIGGVIFVAILVGLFIWVQNNRASSLENAKELYTEGNIEGASEEYKKLLDQFGGTAEVWSNYGNTLRDLKKYEEASIAYKRSATVDATYNLAYRNLSYLHVDWEEIGGGTGKIDEAITFIEDGFDRAGDNKLYLAEDLIMLYGRKGNEAKVNEWKAVRAQLLSEE